MTSTSEGHKQAQSVEVRRSAIHGRGVFATPDFRRGNLVLPIDDSRVVDAEHPLDEAKGEHEHHRDYLGDTIVLMQEPERHINHCCEPNTYVKTVNGLRWVTAYKDIAAGDEITYDYCINSYGDSTWECTCGHPMCRKVHNTDFFKLPREKLVEYLPLLDSWFIDWKRGQVEALSRDLGVPVSSNFLLEIVLSVRTKPSPEGMSTKIIAVDGPGGAGKSTLAARLAEELGGAQVLHTDDFASWENPLNWWPRLVKEVLEPLSRSQPARYRRTDWGNEDHEEWGEVTPAEFVILEGVSASREAFRPFLTYSVWVETPRELRLTRGLERDGEQARAQWEEWMAKEDDYVRREKPRRECADLVVPGDQNLWS